MVQPHPQVPQQEPHRHRQEPHLEPTRRRPDPALIHLAVARLDPEPTPIHGSHPVVLLGTDPPVGVYPRLATRLATLAATIPALDADPDCRLPLPGVAQRVVSSPASLPLLEDLRATGSQVMVRLAAVANDRHQERVTSLLQIAVDLDGVELAVEHQQLDPDPALRAWASNSRTVAASDCPRVTAVNATV